MASCPQCGRVVAAGEQATACPNCGASLAARLQTIEPARTNRLRRTVSTLTIVLIAINVLVFVMMVLTGANVLNPSVQKLVRWGANYGPLTMTGQWWRLETSTFLHGGLFHLLLNMWALLNLGLLAEIIFGADQFLALYLLSGLGGSVASLWWHPTVVGVGASGAIFGIAGALLPALYFEPDDRLRIAMRGNLTSIAFFVFYNILYGAGSLQIDNAAHVGGLGTGVALGFLLPTVTSGRLRDHRRLSLVALATVTVVLIGGALYARTSSVAVVDYANAQNAIRSGKMDEAIDLARQAVEHKPDFTEARYMLGSLYLENKQPELAVSELKKVTSLAPDFSDGFASLCVAQLRTHDPQGAVTSCKKALELDPKDAESQFNLGLAYRGVNDKTNALAALKIAVSMHPDGADENYWLGTVLLESGDYTGATKQFQKVLDIDPNYEGAREALQEVQRRSGAR